MRPITHFCLFVVIVVVASTSVKGQAVTGLFDFDQPSDAAQWQIVNDGVMGGLSNSQASVRKLDSGQSALRFTGVLSLENNGGFASVRSKPTGPLPGGSLGLDAGETIVLRVKGDGRRYTFNLYTPDRRTAFSYQMDFDTVAGQWIDVRLPVDQFVAHSFGRPVANMKLVPNQVHSLGVLIGDKKPGAFELLVDSITVQ